jgi:hypothetical protein
MLARVRDGLADAEFVSVRTERGGRLRLPYPDYLTAHLREAMESARSGATASGDQARIAHALNLVLYMDRYEQGRTEVV